MNSEQQGLHPSVVRAYDIRGRVGHTLHAHDAYCVGRAFGLSLQNLSETPDTPPRACVAYDGRLSSSEFADQVILGLRHAGCHVLEVGLGPTPLLYFSVQHFQAWGGIMVTASHNPAEDNGFKICLHDRPFFGEDLKRLDTLIAHHKHTWAHERPTQSQTIPCEKVEGRRMYQERLESACCLRPLKVAWDPGHGAAGPLVRDLMMTLPGHHIGLHLDVDGTFPAHPPDPTQPQNLQALRQTVLEHGCDVGIGLDGDADRLGVIDAQGEFVSADVLMHLFSADVLRHTPGASVIVDIKTSDSVVETIRHHGGCPVTCRTGHSFIKQKMKETGALCAGELSGHFFFADRYYGFDDGLYAALRLLELLGAQGHEALIQERQRQQCSYRAQDLHIKVPEGHPFKGVQALQDILQRERKPYDSTDGVKVRHAEGWWLLRASNTESKMIGRCEASSPHALQAVVQEMESYWAQAQILLQKD